MSIRLDPVIIRSGHSGSNFFAVVKIFDANIAIIGNFVLIAKNSTRTTTIRGTIEAIL